MKPLFPLTFFIMPFIWGCGSTGNKQAPDIFKGNISDSGPAKKTPQTISSNIENRFSGDWLISSSFPDEKSYNTLRSMYIDGLFGDEGDYIHAKESRQFHKDHEFLFCYLNLESKKWNYFIVNVKNKNIKNIPRDSILNAPDISLLINLPK